MKSLLKRKRGNVEDIVWVIAILFAVVIVLVIIYYIWNQISPEITTSLTEAIPAGETSYNISTTSNQVSGTILSFNALIPFFLVGLIGFVLISAMMIQSHPAFFFIALGLLGIFIVLSVVFSNFYQTLSETSELSSTAASFNIAGLIMKKLPYVVLIIAAIVFIVLWAKPFSFQTGGSV